MPTAGSFELAGVDEPTIAYDHLTGAEIAEPTFPQARALGEAVAALHAAQGNLSRQPLAEPVAQAAHNVACCLPWLAAEDARWLQHAVERADALQQADTLQQADNLLRAQTEASAQCDAPSLGARARPTICHGDLRLGNVLFEGDQPSMFDFEALCLAPPATIWRACGVVRSSNAR